MKTRVYLTIDTECAEERGASDPVLGWDVRVWGRFGNQQRALGIELIMDELARTNTRATFFTEALGSAYFGEAELAKVCGAMLARGHDVQLHTHPRQARANYRSLGLPPASDDIGDYDLATQTAMLQEGVAILTRCGVPAASLRAFRAGNYGASNTTWAAMQRAGLIVSSNYNPCYFEKNCKTRSDRASAGLFQAEHGVWELPITTFVERGGGHRHAQITAISAGETRALLDDAHAAGIAEVTIVTHSFELYHHDRVGGGAGYGRPNTLNILRLRALCRYVADHPERFTFDTVGALAQRIATGQETPPPSPGLPVVHGHDRHKLRRLVEQTFKRLEARARWSPTLV
ncbi:MAG: hypothetical protein NT062_12050 [Proteobacteria bacterium]|nr:hypothetical protein [Pseudomonadota bacterium]